MAKEVGADYVILDGSSQYEGWAFRDEATPPILTVKLFIKDITVFGGASGGTVHITDIDSGDTILPAFETAMDAEQNYPINRWVDGIWSEVIDSGVKVQFNLGYY